mmetsp:Transcript_4229/g.13242  ORF Transcript_4229/g.13242 Transcript_4229/m.13242 type:complete len:201 (-) Transcript_4229:502-1104(-)
MQPTVDRLIGSVHSRLSQKFWPCSGQSGMGVASRFQHQQFPLGLEDLVHAHAPILDVAAVQLLDVNAAEAPQVLGSCCARRLRGVGWRCAGTTQQLSNVGFELHWHARDHRLLVLHGPLQLLDAKRPRKVTLAQENDHRIAAPHALLHCRFVPLPHLHVQPHGLSVLLHREKQVESELPRLLLAVAHKEVPVSRLVEDDP